MSNKTLANKLDKLIEDSNILNKEQLKTQKELNEENEILRNCVESELEDVTVTDEGIGTIMIDDAADCEAEFEFLGNHSQDENYNIKTVTDKYKITAKSPNFVTFINSLPSTFLWMQCKPSGASGVKFYGTPLGTYGNFSNTNNQYFFKQGKTYTCQMWIKGDCPRARIALRRCPISSKTYTTLIISVLGNLKNYHTITRFTPNADITCYLNFFAEGLREYLFYDFEVFFSITEGEEDTDFQDYSKSEKIFDLGSTEMLQRDYIMKKTYVVNNYQKIDSYTGETITTKYISNTGGLDEGATIYYKKIHTTTKSDELQNSLKNASKLKLAKGKNIITIEPLGENGAQPIVKLTYKKSNAIKFQKEIDEIKAMVLDNS